MHLSDVQADAFATAEAKGLHRNLEPDAPVTDREHALILLARLHQQLDTVTQFIKRHGVDTGERTDHHGIESSSRMFLFNEMRAIETMCQTLAYAIGYATLERMSGCTHMSQSAASLIRLALMHTEVSEASECIEDVNATLSPTTCARIAEEVADTVIRGADLVACVRESLDEQTRAKLIYNKQREHGYGTPLAKESA